MRQPADESYLVQLMDLFAESKKNAIIEYICNRILDYGENKIALTRLAECYTAENKTEQRYEVWERLVRIDPEEAELAQLMQNGKKKTGLLKKQSISIKKHSSDLSIKACSQI